MASVSCISRIWADSLSIYRFDGEIAVQRDVCEQAFELLTKQPATEVSAIATEMALFKSNEHESLGAEDDSCVGWEVDSKGTSGKLPSLAVYGIIGSRIRCLWQSDL